MIKKICTKCKEEKELSKFYKNKKGKFGVHAVCKICTKICWEKYYKENKEKKLNNDKKYREKNKEKIIKYQKEYRKTQQKKISKSNKKYYKKNKQKINKKNKQWRKKNNVYIKRWKKKYRNKNREKINKHFNKKKKTDALFRVSCIMRSMIWRSLNEQGYSKKTKTYNILGIKYDNFLNWLNNNASNALNYEMKAVNIDHVIPISFAESEEQILALNHYSNLQLLTAEDNFKKNDSEPAFDNLKRVFDNHPNKEILHNILFK